VERTEVWELISVDPPSLSKPPFPLPDICDEHLHGGAGLSSRDFGKAPANVASTL